MHKKRQIVFGLIFMMLVSVLPVRASNTLFADVSDDSKYFNAISYLKNAGITQGYPDKTFKPDAPITRAEFLKMIMAHADMKHLTPTTKVSNPPIAYSDVKTNDWFKPYVMKASDYGIVQGYSDSTFKPNNNVLLSEGLKILFVAHNSNVPTSDIKTSPFADVAVGSWLLPFAKFAWEKNIIFINFDGSLHADRNLTRAEAAELLFRLNYFIDKGAPFDMASEWQNYENPIQGLSIKVPNGWQIIPENTRFVIWLKDTKNNQSDYEYPTALAAKYVVKKITLQSEDLNQDTYFARMKMFNQQVFPNETVDFQIITVSGFPTLSATIKNKQIWNYYIFNSALKSSVNIYGQSGNGSLLAQNEKLIKAAVNTLKFTDVNTTDDTQIENIISNLNAMINVEGKAKSSINTAGDAVIFYTDVIGVGTGPVDYYYSKKLNMTVKVERNADTILGVRGGKTEKF